MPAPVNQFKAFAIGIGANVLTQAQYEALAELAAGFQTGIASSAAFNKAWRQATFVSAAIMQVVAETLGSDSLDDGDFDAAVARVRATFATFAPPISYLRNVVGQNDTGTPDTVFSVTSDIVTVSDPVSGASKTLFAPGALSCDTSVAGPAAGGRDQAGAFTAGAALKLFYIYNPTTDDLALTWSETGTLADGPALDTDYTLWGYLGTFLTDGSGDLFLQRIRNDHVSYDDEQSVYTAGNHGSTARDLSPYVPVEALTILARTHLDIGGGVVGAGAVSLNISLDATNTFITSECTAGDSNQANDMAFEMPLVLVGGVPKVYTSTSGGIGSNNSLKVNGYTVPNGA